MPAPRPTPAPRPRPAPGSENQRPPIVCDLRGAVDTPAARVAAYASLFADALVARERTPSGVRFRFRAGADIEARVRELAAREAACCGFFTFAVTAGHDEVTWDASVVDDPIARRVLDELYELPETASGGVEAVAERLDRLGLPVVRPCCPDAEL